MSCSCNVAASTVKKSLERSRQPILTFFVSFAGLAVGRPAFLPAARAQRLGERAILEPNGSRSGDEMFEEFVGRAPSTEAWLREKGFRP